MGLNIEKTILAIDPGASGGIAWVHPVDKVFRVKPMPTGMTAIYDLFNGIALESPAGVEAIMEQVGAHFPGNRASASVKFGRHVGNLEAVLFCLKIPTRVVAPVAWMKPLRPLPTGMAAPQKLARKRAILEKVRRMFPYCASTITLKTADALGILAWRLGVPAPAVDWLE